MKVLKIEFHNINSLKGSHKIDFTKAPFNLNALFAITGPTGSGKSTILDVISLALFNMVPRLGKISKNEIINKGALLTRNQKEASARITYECKAGKYVSEWSISTNRNENLRDYEMCLFDANTGKALDYKKSDVPSKNEELIGLNYDQFIKSVLLAQGDFAQFLKAKKDERGELLEKITGTGIYRKLGIRAFQKFKEVNSTIEDKRTEINLLKNDLLEEHVLHEIEKNLSKKTADCSPLEKSIVRLEKQIELKKVIESQVEQISKTEQNRKQATERWKKFEEEHGDLLNHHEQVQIFAEDLRSWDLLSKSCSELQEELKKNDLLEKKNKADIKNCVEKIEIFLKMKPHPERIEENLHEFSKKVRKLQQSRQEKIQSYNNLRNRFNIEVREVPFSLKGNLEEDEEKLKELQSSVLQKLEILRSQMAGIDLDNYEREKLRLRKEFQQGRQAQLESEGIKQVVAELDAFIAEEEKLRPELEVLPQKIKLAEANAATLEEKVEKLEVQRQFEILKANLENHRHSLTQGEPCPLCGSKEHPYAKELPLKNDEIEQQIFAARAEIDMLKREISSRKTTLEHHQKRTIELQKFRKDKQQKLQKQKGNFEQKFSSVQPVNRNWEQFLNSLEEQLDLLESFQIEKRKLEAISQGLPVLSEIKKVLVQGKEIKAELDSLYSGNDIDTDCLDLQKSWTDLQHQKRSLEQLLGDINIKAEGKTAELETVEKLLQPKVSELDCKEIKEALQRLLPETKYIEIRKQRENLFFEKREFEASLKTLQEQLEKLIANDTDLSKEKLAEEIQQKKDNLQVLKKDCEELRRNLLNDRDRGQKIEKMEKEISQVKEKVKRWELLDRLIGDSKGKRFNDFAQDLSLSQLLILANHRLSQLNDRYRISKPLEGEDDSLVAIDDHMGSQRRSVKTLSGGETFLLSLSMALALSDMASRNIEINSLFIDEGFGTLDPETLDQTLDALEKLQAESSKTIGVISHVDSLKERIATQIKLSRNGQGYSSMVISG